MRAAEPAWRGVRALWAVLCLALSLAVAPSVEAVKHGPGAMAGESDHRAYHAEHGHAHDIAGADHHDSSDHDHVGEGRRPADVDLAVSMSFAFGSQTSVVALAATG